MTAKWPYVPLSSIAKREERAEFPQPDAVYRQAGVRLWGEGAYEREPITGAETKYAKLFRIETGDLIFNKIWARNGSIAVVPDALHGCFVSAEFPVFSLLRTHVAPDWLRLLTRTQSFWAECDKRSHGSSGQNRINPKEILAIPIPLPPLPEQERIVRLLGAAEELRRLREQADRRTADIVPALFHEMFGDPVSNPNGWPVKRLSEVGKLDRGRSRHRPRDEPSLYGGPYPFVQTGDIANANGVIRRYSQTYSEVGLAQSRLWPAGTLCITIAANIAKTAVLSFDACFPDSIVGFIPGENVVIDYVRQWFVTIESRLEEAAPQSAQKNINLAILSTLFIPVPPLSLQTKFAARVAEVRALEAKQAESRRRLDELFHSLLHRAFRGEL